MYAQIIGISAGLGTTVSFLPQVFRIMRSDSTDGLSIHMIISQLMGTSLWTIYGVLTGDLIIVSYNGVSALLLMLIIYQYARLQLRERNTPEL